MVLADTVAGGGSFGTEDMGRGGRAGPLEHRGEVFRALCNT